MPAALAWTLWAVLLALLAAAVALALWQHARLREARHGESRRLLAQFEALATLLDELALPARLPAITGGAGRPDFLLALARHVWATRPRLVVECGSGLSTLVLARALQQNGDGHVYALEHDQEFAAWLAGELERLGVADRATLLVAQLGALALGGETWPWYAEDTLPAGEIDMLVVDGPPGRLRPLARYPAGPMLFDRMRIGAAAFLDDARRGKERRVLARWTREFPWFRQEWRDT